MIHYIEMCNEKNSIQYINMIKYNINLNEDSP